MYITQLFFDFIFVSFFFCLFCCVCVSVSFLQTNIALFFINFFFFFRFVCFLNTSILLVLLLLLLLINLVYFNLYLRLEKKNNSFVLDCVCGMVRVYDKLQRKMYEKCTLLIKIKTPPE